MLLRRFALAALALTGGFLAVPACSNETIVLAQISDTDAGTTPPPPVRCVASADVDASDCPPGYYCSLSSCSAAAGTCVLAPVVCPNTESPVCGSDGITYFNDCWAQAYGVPCFTNEPCELNGVLCGGPSDVACPQGSGAFCAQLGPPHGPCTPNLPGTCWVLPPDCPTSTPSDLWDSCSSTGAVCLDTCSAIKAGGPYRRSQVCGQ
jgi:hypothetical protein